MIAFLATTARITTNDSPSEDTHLYILPVGGGSPRCLTRSIDRRIENISWQSGGEYIYFTAGNEGKTSVYRVSVTTGIIETIIDREFHILEYSLSLAAKDIVYVSTDINHPAEIFLFKQEQNSIIQITGLNNELLVKCKMGDAESVWFKSFDGTDVQGWIMRPAVFDTAETYPLILVIHGGPHNMFGYEFEDRMQLLSAHGYAVLFINPRGSSGYGQAFSNGNVLNWGGGDYKDLMAGVDCIIDKFKWIDKEKIGVTGQSYGGYMTNWIITQTNRFKAAVVDGGISNLISFSGTSLYHSLMESEFNGSVYDNFHLLWQWSPLRNVKNVTTPTLLLHGELDNEVPKSQAEEMYVALKKAGVKTTLIHYIGEGHGWRPDLSPKNKYDLNSRIINWFDQHINAAKSP
jgi:dipeptidyl aminopeptidase/acylaminoacyl peptidase